MATGEYIDHGITVLITGAAGTGKSYFAYSIGDRTCRQKKVICFTMNRFVENLKLAKLEGRQPHFFKKIYNRDMLIINDFGIKLLEGELQIDFEQIIDD